MVDGNLDEVTGEMGSTAQQNIEDLLGNEFPPSERPVEGLNGSVPGEEVVSTDIGISGKCMKASAHKYERRGVIYLVEDDLKDLIGKTVHIQSN
jgi:hypothetical protein